MGQSADAHELLQVAGGELGAVVGDDAWLFAGRLHKCAPKDDFDIGLGQPTLLRRATADSAQTLIILG